MIHKYTNTKFKGGWAWPTWAERANGSGSTLLRLSKKYFKENQSESTLDIVFPLFWLQKANFTMWGRGAPSGKKKNAEDCAYFVIHKGLMVWRDLPCGWVFVLYSGLEWFAESRDQNVQGEEVGVVCQRGEAVLTAPASTSSNTTSEKTAAKEKELTKLYNRSRF